MQKQERKKNSFNTLKNKKTILQNFLPSLFFSPTQEEAHPKSINPSVN